MARTERTIQDAESDYIIYTSHGWKHEVSGTTEDLNTELRRIVRHHGYLDMTGFKIYKRII